MALQLIREDAQDPTPPTFCNLDLHRVADSVWLLSSPPEVQRAHNTEPNVKTRHDDAIDPKLLSTTKPARFEAPM